MNKGAIGFPSRLYYTLTIPEMVLSPAAAAETPAEAGTLALPATLAGTLVQILPQVIADAVAVFINEVSHPAIALAHARAAIVADAVTVFIDKVRSRGIRVAHARAAVVAHTVAVGIRKPGLHDGRRQFHRRRLNRFNRGGLFLRQGEGRPDDQDDRDQQT